MPAVSPARCSPSRSALDDFVVSFFTTGPGATTLPILIYSSVKRGITPDINALSTLIVLVSIVGTLGGDAAAAPPQVPRRILMKQDRSRPRRPRAARRGLRPEGGCPGPDRGRRSRRRPGRPLQAQSLHLERVHRPGDRRRLREGVRLQGHHRPLRGQRDHDGQAAGRRHLALRRRRAGQLHHPGDGEARPARRAATTRTSPTSRTSTRSSSIRSTTRATSTRSPTSGAPSASTCASPPPRRPSETWGLIFDTKKQPGTFLLMDSPREMMGVTRPRTSACRSTRSTPRTLRKVRDATAEAKKRSQGFEGRRRRQEQGARQGGHRRDRLQRRRGARHERRPRHRLLRAATRAA